MSNKSNKSNKVISNAAALERKKQTDLLSCTRILYL